MRTFIAFVGLSSDLKVVRGLNLPLTNGYTFCEHPSEVSTLADADELVFVISRSNQVSSELVLILEAVDASAFQGFQRILNLDECEIHPVHRQIRGLPEMTLGTWDLMVGS